MSNNFTLNIPGNECIGDSLVKINGNFSELDTAATSLSANKVSKSGDSMSGFLTLHASPTATNHAATKGYVLSQIPKTSVETWNGYDIFINALVSRNSRYNYWNERGVNFSVSGFADVRSEVSSSIPSISTELIVKAQMEFASNLRYNLDYVLFVNWQTQVATTGGSVALVHPTLASISTPSFMGFNKSWTFNTAHAPTQIDIISDSIYPPQRFYLKAIVSTQSVSQIPILYYTDDYPRDIRYSIFAKHTYYI